MKMSHRSFQQYQYTPYFYILFLQDIIQKPASCYCCWSLESLKGSVQNSFTVATVSFFHPHFYQTFILNDIEKWRADTLVYWKNKIRYLNEIFSYEKLICVFSFSLLMKKCKSKFLVKISMQRIVIPPPMQLLQQHYRMSPEGGKARHGSDYTRLKFDVSNIGAADQLLKATGSSSRYKTFFRTKELELNRKIFKFLKL